MELKKNYSFLMLLILILGTSCSSNSSSPTPTPTPPSSDGKSHYTTDVAPIVNGRCISCHGVTPTNGAPMSLTSLDLVKDAILNRGLIDRISRAQGTVGMMPNGGTRLAQADIDKIAKWQTDGFLN